MLKMISSDLGKTQIINSDLSSNWKCTFANTNMLQLAVIGTQLPYKIIVPDGSSYILSEQERLAYGQLKKIYENNNDSINFTYYHSKGLTAIKEYLKYKAKKSGKEKADLISLTINDYSSRFNDSLLRAFYVLISFCIVSYCIFCLSLGFYHFTSDWSKFFRLCSYFPSYMSPIRSNEMMFSDPVLNITSDNNPKLFSFGIFWDSISRIIISYLIYQFIQAFRKYGKRNQ